MIRDITIGQYYPIESFIHRLDPRTKIIGTFFYILVLFISDNLVNYGLSILALLIVIKTSKVPVKFMLKGLKSIFFIIFFTVIINLFFSTGEELVISYWKINIYKEGIYIAVFMATRLILLIISSSILTLTTTPIELTDGIEYLLKPFEKIKVPAHEIAMMTTIALRFIPILLEETDKIMKAQSARGADFESGSIIKRGKSLIPLLVPLFVSSFRRADDLALAMESRCYNGGKGRTRLKSLKYNKQDFFTYFIIIVYFGLIIILKYFR